MKGSSFLRQVSYPWKNSGSRQVKKQTYSSKSEWNCVYRSEQTSQFHNSFFRSVAFLFSQKQTFINTKFIAKYLVIVPLNCSQEGDKRLLINRKLSPCNATEVYFFLCFWIMINPSLFRGLLLQTKLENSCSLSGEQRKFPSKPKSMVFMAGWSRISANTRKCTFVGSYKLNNDKSYTNKQ